MPVETKTRESEHIEPPIELIERQDGQDVPPWKYLVARRHAWRKQLEIRGRNITVGQLVRSIRANHLTPEQASFEFDLPVGAVEEAIQYASDQKDLLEAEANEERRRLREKGCALEPEDLPR